jgi:hypothetical protein
MSGPLVLVSRAQNTTSADKFGASVFSHDDQYRKLVLFKRALLETHSTVPQLYVVSLDISKSYDTIKQTKLYALVQQLFHQDEYLVQQMKRTQIKAHSASTRHQYVVHASGLGSFPQFSKQAAAMAQSLRNAILSDVVNYDYEETPALLQLLHQHIFQNIVKVRCGPRVATDRCRTGPRATCRARAYHRARSSPRSSAASTTGTWRPRT